MLSHAQFGMIIFEQIDTIPHRPSCFDFLRMKVRRRDGVGRRGYERQRFARCRVASISLPHSTDSPPPLPNLNSIQVTASAEPGTPLQLNVENINYGVASPAVALIEGENLMKVGVFGAGAVFYDVVVTRQ